MRRLLGSVGMLMAFGGCQASSRTQAERPSAEQSPAASQPKALIGDCSRCYVEILNPEDPAVRVRFCGQAPASEGLGSSTTAAPRPPICCRECGPLRVAPEPPESLKDTRISVGPDAEVRFERGPLQVSRRGPTEFALSEVGLDHALPLQVVCHPPLSGR